MVEQGEYELLTQERAPATDHPGHKYFARRYAYAREKVKEPFAQIRSDGYLRNDIDADRLAENLMAPMMDGLQIQWVYEPGSVGILERLKSAVESYLAVPYED